MTFAQLAQVMISEYNSNARRLGVQSQLETLTNEAYMTENEIADYVVGLAKVVDHISILTPQCPANLRSESNKIRFWRHAVLSRPWAERAIGNITTALTSL